MTSERLVTAIDSSNALQLQLLVHRAKRGDIDGAVDAMLNISDGLRQCVREGALDDQALRERVLWVTGALIRELGLIKFGRVAIGFAGAIKGRDGYDMIGAAPRDRN